MSPLRTIRRASLLAIALAATCAFAQNPPPNTTFVGGQAMASAFGRWSAPGIAQGSAGGTGTVQMGVSYVTAVGGQAIEPFFAGVPLTISDGANTETVTVISSNCQINSQSSCNWSAHFANSHNGGVLITSGTKGLQEAVNTLLIQGGTVVTTPDWNGTTAQIEAAVGNAKVEILDEHTGAYTWYGWTGSAYAAAFCINNPPSGINCASFAPGVNLVNPQITGTGTTIQHPEVNGCPLVPLHNDIECNYYTDQMGGLAAAVSTLGSTPATLYASEAETLSGTVTVPANIHLVPVDGAGMLTVPSGATLIVTNGPSGLDHNTPWITEQSGGAVEFLSGQDNPWWFGLAAGSGAASGNTTAINQAIAAVSVVANVPGGGRIYFDWSGRMYATGPIVAGTGYSSGVAISGLEREGTELEITGSGGGTCGTQSNGQFQAFSQNMSFSDWTLISGDSSADCVLNFTGGNSGNPGARTVWTNFAIDGDYSEPAMWSISYPIGMFIGFQVNVAFDGLRIGSAGASWLFRQDLVQATDTGSNELDAVQFNNTIMEPTTAPWLPEVQIAKPDDVDFNTLYLERSNHNYNGLWAKSGGGADSALAIHGAYVDSAGPPGTTYEYPDIWLPGYAYPAHATITPSQETTAACTASSGSVTVGATVIATGMIAPLQRVWLAGCGTAGGWLQTVVATVTSGTTITVSPAAATTNASSALYWPNYSASGENMFSNPAALTSGASQPTWPGWTAAGATVSDGSGGTAGTWYNMNIGAAFANLGGEFAMHIDGASVGTSFVCAAAITGNYSDIANLTIQDSRCGVQGPNVYGLVEGGQLNYSGTVAGGSNLISLNNVFEDQQEWSVFDANGLPASTQSPLLHVEGSSAVDSSTHYGVFQQPYITGSGPWTANPNGTQDIITANGPSNAGSGFPISGGHAGTGTLTSLISGNVSGTASYITTMQHARTAFTCATGTFCAVPFDWPTSFADTNYTTTCSIVMPNGYQTSNINATVWVIVTGAGTAEGMVYVNGAAPIPSTSYLSCLAFHD